MTTTNTSVDLLLCRVDEHVVGIPLEVVVETLRPLPIEALTGAPEYVLGLSVIRGHAEPVVDLGHLVSGKRAPIRRFVSLRVEARTVALGVQAVLGVQRVDTATLGALPPLLRDTAHHVLEGLRVLDAALLLVLSSAHGVPGAVFPSIETSA